MIDLAFAVPIEPMGSPRPRARVVGRGAQARAHIYMPSESGQWQLSFWARVPNNIRQLVHQPISESVRVDMALIFTRPKSLKGQDPAWKGTKPDLDNCAKMVLDAMAPLWVDDNLVTLGTWLKIYAPPGASGGVSIRIRSASQFNPQAVAAALGLEI